MGEGRSNFRQLERINRRKTVELVAIFILVYCVLGLVLDLVFHRFSLAAHRLVGFLIFTVAAAVIASAQALGAYYRGSTVLIGAVDGSVLEPNSTKTQIVVDVVEEMARAARIPRPRLCLIDDSAPNAFAAGRNPDHSVICVTQGLVDQLDREELQGVIAHEVAHIRERDTCLSQMAAVMVGGFALVSGAIWRKARARQRGDHFTLSGLGFVAVPILVISALGWICSKIAAIALSRQREFLADSEAVEFTRNPLALIRALEHIARIESPLKKSMRGLAPLFIVDPFECGSPSWAEYLDGIARIESQHDKSKEQRDAEVAQHITEGMPRSFFGSALSSHPPIHNRIVRLRELLDGSSNQHESDAEVSARRRAAASTLKQVLTSNPEAMAAVIGEMLEANPAQQLKGETTSPTDRIFANTADQAVYQTLQAALTTGIGGTHEELVVASANTAEEPKTPKMLRVMFWIVIALSAGAIAAALTII